MIRAFHKVNFLVLSSFLLFLLLVLCSLVFTPQCSFSSVSLSSSSSSATFEVESPPLTVSSSDPFAGLFRVVFPALPSPLSKS